VKFNGYVWSSWILHALVLLLERVLRVAAPKSVNAILWSLWNSIPDQAIELVFRVFKSSALILPGLAIRFSCGILVCQFLIWSLGKHFQVANYLVAWSYTFDSD
jgi:hypothetical protein